MISQEFQAIVMAAGKGSRITELTGRRPKCLLPIGNLPMVWYPLNLLERAGFSDALVVVVESVKNEVQSALEKCGLKIRFEIIGIPSNDDWGTADSLRHLHETNKIKSDLVVVPCDLITDVNLNNIMNIFRQHDATLVALFSKHAAPPVLPTPGPKTKQKIERDFVGVDAITSRLVFIASASDYEETLPFSKRLLHRYGQISLHSRLTDGHVYIINKWLCHYLTVNRSLSTLKGEVLPHVVKKHTQSTNRGKFDFDKDKTSLIGMDPKNDIFEFSQDKDADLKIRSLSSYTDRRSHEAYNHDSIRCYANIDNNAYLVRANTIHEYCRANREIFDFWAKIHPSDDSSEAGVLSVTGDRCILSNNAKIAERTTIKSSIIGPGAVISTKTRVADSIVMNGAKIGEKCIIENCIICEESVVEDGCTIKNCLVGSHHVVASGSNHSNEVLTDEDGLMEF